MIEKLALNGERYLKTLASTTADSTHPGSPPAILEPPRIMDEATEKGTSLIQRNTEPQGADPGREKEGDAAPVMMASIARPKEPAAAKDSSVAKKNVGHREAKSESMKEEAAPTSTPHRPAEKNGGVPPASLSTRPTLKVLGRGSGLGPSLGTISTATPTETPQCSRRGPGIAPDETAPSCDKRNPLMEVSGGSRRNASERPLEMLAEKNAKKDEPEVTVDDIEIALRGDPAPPNARSEDWKAKHQRLKNMHHNPGQWSSEKLPPSPKKKGAMKKLHKKTQRRKSTKKTTLSPSKSPPHRAYKDEWPSDGGWCSCFGMSGSSSASGARTTEQESTSRRFSLT
eukprot:CAMPEP_0167810840 /NCGR_PEP_ID=MMETSP0112_2-20121227/314_1 /TAXON_ID=91324 /ORGANISM="Lotharella globosa, Strain CCCM811" /LENGTH=341 /DNA_ID=CAMNT_0007709441 /DNA_START=15 /DNA_END=1044 /DNA_ORIENTATION=+